MSGSNSEADAIRAALASNLTPVKDGIAATLTAMGNEVNVSNMGTDYTGLTIDNTTGVTTSALFLSTGFSFIENVNDTSPVVASGTNSANQVEYYQGDSGGQTFVTGNGFVFAAMTGFGNTVETPTTSGGLFTIATGLASAATSTSALASPTVVGGVEQGNTIVSLGGTASIAAGLGANGIFLGKGIDTVASEGHDTIYGGTGSVTVDGTTDGSGSILFYSTVTGGGASSTSIYGNAESATVFGGNGSIQAFGGSSGNNVLAGGAGNVTFFGGGNNDLLVAGSANSVLVAGTGNETLFGGGATSTSDFFAGGAGSSDSIIAGTGNNYIQFGAGNTTVFGSGAYDLYGVHNGLSGGLDQIVGFNTAHDFLSLQGYGADAATIFADDVSTDGTNTSIKLSDNTHIELWGVANFGVGNIITST